MVGEQGQSPLSLSTTRIRRATLLARRQSRGKPMVPMIESEQHYDPGLRAANLALSGRKRREVSRITSLELRFSDPKSEPWEALAMISVGLLSVLVVLGLWLA